MVVCVGMKGKSGDTAGGQSDVRVPETTKNLVVKDRWTGPLSLATFLG